jgi:hypothetical protein
MLHDCSPEKPYDPQAIKCQYDPPFINAKYDLKDIVGSSDMAITQKTPLLLS